MPRIIKGEIQLSEEEYHNLSREMINGKIYYIYRSRDKEEIEKDIDKIEFEYLVNSGKKSPFIIKYLHTTKHYFREFLKKNYNTDNFTEVKKMIL